MTNRGPRLNIIMPPETGVFAEAVDSGPFPPYGRALSGGIVPHGPGIRTRTMKIVNSLKSMKARHKDCRIIRRKGRVYVINKTNPRFKARQG